MELRGFVRVAETGRLRTARRPRDALACDGAVRTNPVPPPWPRRSSAFHGSNGPAVAGSGPNSAGQAARQRAASVPAPALEPMDWEAATGDGCGMAARPPELGRGSHGPGESSRLTDRGIT